ncbi:MAG: tol-pal system protein YbgF [Nitrospirales bacterium]
MLPMSGKVAVWRPLVCVWVIGIGLCLTLSGCLAQKADMTRMGKTLDRKIAKLDAREKALQQNIAEAEKKIARQSKEAERLLRLVTEARARLRQDITELREESLPILHGKLEETGHYLKRNREDIDNLNHGIETLTQVALKQQVGNEKRLTAIEKAQQKQWAALTSDRKALQKKLSQVEQSLRTGLGRVEALGPTLESLAKAMDARLGEQDQAIEAARLQSNRVVQQLEARTRTLQGQLATLRETLPKFKQALTELGEQLVEENARIVELTGHLTQVTQKVDTDMQAAAKYLGEVTAKVDADTQVTGTHLEKVSQSVASVAKALTALGAAVNARVDAHERRFEETSTHLVEVNKSVGSVVQALNSLSADVTARAKAQDARVNTTAIQIEEVNQSVASVAEALKAMSATVMERVDAQEARIEEATKSLQAVTTEVNSLIQAVGRLDKPSANQTEGRRSGALTPATKSIPLGVSPGGDVASATASIRTRARGDSRRLEARAKERYEGILAMFKQGHLDEARQGFREFLVQYPTSTRAPNAQYWLGECFYGNQQYTQAIEAYDRVEAEYPQSAKVPAALLKKGYAYLALKDRQQARKILEQIVRSYRGSPEAGKASGRLAQLQGSR